MYTTVSPTTTSASPSPRTAKSSTFLPIRILAPDGAEQPEIELWLETYADDWVVGPTFVSVTKETTDEGVRITALRL